MKITRADTGSTVLMKSWSRSNRSLGILTQNVVIDKIGRVNITLSGNQYRIISNGDFSLKASCGDVSDSWVEIYLHADDVIKSDDVDRIVNALSNPSHSLIGKISSLSLEKLKKIELIINGGQ